MCSAHAPAAYRWADEADDAADAAAGRSAEDSPAGRREATDESGRRRRLEYPPAPEPLPVPVVDNHTHLNFRDGLVEVGVKEALDAAAAVGVDRAVQVGCDLPSSRFTVEALEIDARLLGAVALHPNDAPLYAARGELDAAYAEIEQLAQHPRVRAIGETGLDYFRSKGDALAVQDSSFRWHIDLAKRLGKTLQIHDRDAHDDVVRILTEEGAPEQVVFHCFSGDEELARTCNENGWFLSFAGTFTFKNADNLRRAIAMAEPSRILVETDSPFLTPHPYRGRPNASYMVPYTVRSMAEVLGADLAELCSRLSANTEEAYGSWT
ncbi:TatD family hydrolase [Sinomonas sp. P10A9]|uniref:TatD family hydrolase n=1 Tax=Sinomonas puerhi TaxID=3238584 RepID=A0AB39L8X7_9MICC